MRGAPEPPEAYYADGEIPEDERLDTDEKLRAGGWAAGLDVWEQMGKAYEWYLSQGQDTPDDLDNAQMWSLQQAIKAQPMRGDAVEAWIKRERDHFSHGSVVWLALDDMLDDYREHADTGVPLGEEVHGPEGTN